MENFKGFDKKLIIKDAAKLLPDPQRRLFLKNGLSLGALVMLSGCKLTDGNSVDAMLESVSRYNDKVQAWLFDPDKLAPEYAESKITRPFPFNAYYSENEIRPIPENYVLKVSGLVERKGNVTLREIHAMPQFSQVTRHICVEGWSAIGKWSGVRFSEFLNRVGADKTAKFVGFKCFDDYHTSIDMPTALHPQTQLTLGFDDKELPGKYGAPLKLRMPTKLGFKNPKHIAEIYVTNKYPGGFWEDQGYNWFSGS